MTLDPTLGVQSPLFANISENVNPLHIGKGLVMGRKCLSIAQQRKPWLSGWQVVVVVLQAQWGALFPPDNAAACVHVMYGYYCSVAESVLRMASNLESVFQSFDNKLKSAAMYRF